MKLLQKWSFIPASLLIAGGIALGVALNGCGYKTEEAGEERIEGIERILMHEPSDYTFLIRLADSPKLQFRRVVLNPDYHSGRGEGTPTVVTDVKPDEPRWALIKYRRTDGSNGVKKYAYYLELHLRSVKDINGAGWEKPAGKNTTRRGQTQVIE